MRSPCTRTDAAASTLRLARIPLPEEETPLVAGSSTALERWQARPGEILTVVDPSGTAWRARLLHHAPAPVALPFKSLHPFPESRVQIALAQALPERERFELILQKGVELGVRRFLPFESQRSQTLAERDRPQRKSHRWPDVVLRAAKQCRRACLPELAPVTPWAGLLAVRDGLRLLLVERGESVRPLDEAVRDWTGEDVLLAVGPEGGFTDEEIGQARQAGFLPVTLGSRILRTETAAIVGVALLQHLLGDLGREVR